MIAPVADACQNGRGKETGIFGVLRGTPTPAAASAATGTRRRSRAGRAVFGVEVLGGHHVPLTPIEKLFARVFFLNVNARAATGGGATPPCPATAVPITPRACRHEPDVNARAATGGGATPPCPATAVPITPRASRHDPEGRGRSPHERRMIRAGFSRAACRCAAAADRAIYAVFVNARARHAGEDEIGPVGGNAHNLFIRVSGNGRGRHFLPRLSAVQLLFPKPAVGGVELAPGLDQAINRPRDGRRFNGHFRLNCRKDASEIARGQQTRAE